jgi:phosphoglycerol transferase MdoB-like AlkP superfamily enzyme
MILVCNMILFLRVRHISLIIKMYLLALSFFSFFRLILFYSQLHRIDNTVSNVEVFQAFIMGLRFDVVISGYIFILPYVVLMIQSYAALNASFLNKLIFYYVFIFCSLAFLVCAADIPYFNQFFSLFSITAFEWMDSPGMVFRMIIEENHYWLYLVPFLIVVFVFYNVLNKILNTKDEFRFPYHLSINVVISFLVLGLMILGIRGRIEEKSPIRVGTAFFSNNPFLNQLGLNPNFTLIRSYLDSRLEENKKLHLMDESKAILYTQTYLGIKKPDNQYPLLRSENINGNNRSNKQNVVIVMMESMSAAKMKRHGNVDDITPFLDSISTKGYYFENAYSADIHTFNGIFSTLFSYPALFRQHPMNESAMYKYHGIATTLKKHDYSTVYFTTHDGQFDNVQGFLKGNDYDRVVELNDYPSERAMTTLGVPDDYMFEYSISVLDDLHKKGKPFMAAFMTASDHGPYYIPAYFKPTKTEEKLQIIEYADYSLRKFINLAAKKKWFDNTIFVFVADRGAPLTATYDLSLDYNHTPLLFYAPKLIKESKVFHTPAGQIDVFPSIMGLLNLPYDNYTLGVNLFNHQRPYIYFNADDKFGVIDSSWLLIVRDAGDASLFRYRKNDLKNFASEYP